MDPDPIRGRLELVAERRFPGGDLALRRLGPVILGELRGILPNDAGIFFGETLATLLDAGEGLQLFFDAEGLESYEPEVRRAPTRLLLQRRSRIASIHALRGDSTLVRMGLSVANVALGGRIRAYAARAKFDEALAAALDET